MTYQGSLTIGDRTFVAHAVPAPGDEWRSVRDKFRLCAERRQCTKCLAAEALAATSGRDAYLRRLNEAAADEIAALLDVTQHLGRFVALEGFDSVGAYARSTLIAAHRVTDAYELVDQLITLIREARAGAVAAVVH